MAAGLQEVGGVGLGDLCVVDNACLGGVEGGDTSGVRLKTFQFVGADSSKTGDAIGNTASVKLFEGWNFRFVNGDDYLAAFLVRDVALVTVLSEEPGAFYAVAGLEGTRSVVDPGMDDAAVMAGLVPGEVGFLFEDNDGKVGEAEKEFRAEDRPRMPPPITATSKSGVIPASSPRTYRLLGRGPI